jgi:NAD(P)H-flavin reductase
VRTPEEIPYRAELEAWARHPRVRVEITLSRPPPGWTGRSGHVQTHLAEIWKAFQAQEPEAMVYVAGWKRMVWPVEDLLRMQLGLDKHHLRVEVFDPES